MRMRRRNGEEYMNENEYRAYFPARARAAIEVLNRAGFDAYFVGGCVRDFYMGRMPHDFDITTNAKSEDILRCFEHEGLRAYPKGGACGTVGVGRADEEVEITPYRTENGYYDHRHPQNVTFVDDIADDLSRRDFTANALAAGYDRNGAFRTIDLFGGRRDIEEKCLRCVGDARVRFEEDALRMLRAVRFAATLSFSVADETKEALCEKTPLLSYISGERKSAELRKLLCAEKCERVVNEFSDFLSSFLGKLEPRFLDAVKPDFILRLFYLTRSRADGDEVFAHDIAALKLSGDELSTLLRLRAIYAENERAGEIPPERLAHFIAAHGYFMKSYFSVFPSKEGSAILSDGTLPKTLSELSVGGKELLALGFSGKEVGNALHTLLYRCLAGECKNVRGELLSCALLLRER